jgi:hypothetical protein
MARFGMVQLGQVGLGKAWVFLSKERRRWQMMEHRHNCPECGLDYLCNIFDCVAVYPALCPDCSGEKTE